jgi:hypothetical protein
VTSSKGVEMGYCIEGENCHDVFLSYARDDNTAHNRWVEDFESYLKEKVEAEIRRIPHLDNVDAKKFSVCRDETGFPESGDLARVINEKVQQSQFLFVFLGKAYLKSKYCLSELEIFRQATGGVLEDMLDRTYVIVLDQEAVEQLRKGNPEGLAAEYHSLWNKLRDVSHKAIRKEDLLLNGSLLPVRSEPDRFNNTFHERCTPLVQEFTSKLIERRKFLHPQQRQPGHGPAGASRQVVDRILVGVVPPRLTRARDDLIRELGTASVGVIDRKELRHEPNKLRERFAGARLFIQPFDDLEPLFGWKRPDPDPPGGHLGLQKQLFDKYAAPGMEMLWWKPLSSNAQEAEVPPMTGSPEDNAPIAEYDAKFLDEIPSAQRRHCTAHALAAEILAPPSRPSVTAKVWVEWEETDRRKIRQAKELVHTYFERVCTGKKREHQIDCSAAIEFGDADWPRLTKRGAFGDSYAFRSRCRWRPKIRLKVPLYLAQRSASISLLLASYHHAPERLSRT